MGKKSSPPREPNLQPIADSQLAASREAMELARQQMGLSREQWTWFQQNAGEELAVARAQADRAFGLQERMFASDQEMNELASAVGSTQMEAMRQQMEYGQRDRERYENTFIPMQDRMIAEADAYATPERREAEAARIGGDIQRQAEAQRSNADQRLRSMGVDPSQVRSTSMANQMGVATAANQAMGMNAAREMIDDKGRAMRADAINLGTGLPMQSLAGYGAAGQAGQGALQAGQAGQASTIAAGQAGMAAGGFGMGARNTALQQYGAMTGTPMQWAGQANQSMGMGGNFMNAGANTINQGYANRYQRWQGVQEQGQRWFDNTMAVGNMVGNFMSMAEGGPVNGALPRHHMAGGGMMGGGFSEATEKATQKRMQKEAEYAQQRQMRDSRWQQSLAQSNADFKASSGVDAGPPTFVDFNTSAARAANARNQVVGGSQYQMQPGVYGSQQPMPQGTVTVGPVEQMPAQMAEGGKVFDPNNSSDRGYNGGGYSPAGSRGANMDMGRPQMGGGGGYSQMGNKPEPGFNKYALPRHGYGGGAARQDDDIVRGGYQNTGVNKGNFVNNMVQRPGVMQTQRRPYAGYDEAPGRMYPTPQGQPGVPYDPRGIMGDPNMPYNTRMLQDPNTIKQYPMEPYTHPRFGMSQNAPGMMPTTPYGAPMYMAEGGSPRGALPVKQARDRIPAMLAEGEYVLPADVVRSLGLEKIDKLVAKYHRPGA